MTTDNLVSLKEYLRARIDGVAEDFPAHKTFKGWLAAIEALERERDGLRTKMMEWMDTANEVSRKWGAAGKYAENLDAALDRLVDDFTDRGYQGIADQIKEAMARAGVALAAPKPSPSGERPSRWPTDDGGWPRQIPTAGKEGGNIADRVARWAVIPDYLNERYRRTESAADLGWECRICGARCDHDDAVPHAPSCPLAQVNVEGNGNG